MRYARVYECHGGNVTSSAHAKENLVVYYSYSGNNQLLAEYFAHKLEAPLAPIQEKRHRRPMTIFLDVFLNRTPEIEPLAYTLDHYNHLILIAPIWNGKIASPLKSLLKNHRMEINSYSFLTVCGGYEKKNQLDTIKIELENLVGKAPDNLFEFDVSDLLPQSDRKKIRKVSAYHLKPQDLDIGFQQKIEEALSAQRSVPPNRKNHDYGNPTHTI